MLVAQDLTNAALADPVLIEQREQVVIPFSFKVQNLSGSTATSIGLAFSAGISLRPGDVEPAAIGNNSRVTINAVIDPTAMVRGVPKDFAVTITAAGDLSVTATARVTITKAKIGPRARNRRRSQ